MNNRLDHYFSDLNQKKIAQFYDLMVSWNKTHNLTRIINQEHFYTHHIIDTAVTSPHIPPNIKNALDLGTGCGIPGIILALLHPQTHWHLIDAKEKRIIFLKNVIHQLQIENVTPVHARIEKFTPSAPIDLIISRAVTRPQMILDLTQHLHHPDLQIFLMRAKPLTQPFNSTSWVGQEIPLSIPQTDLTRHLLIMQPQRSLP